MSPSSEKISALRDLLAHRFPQASTDDRGRHVATGLASVDEATGGFPCGAITEIVCPHPSCGSMLFLSRVLESSRAQRLRVALIDGSDHFDPQSFSSDLLAHLVWIRARTLKDVLLATDLIARDANFGLVAVDIRTSQLELEFRKEPPTSWYRLQRAAEQTDLPLLVQTPRALVPSAQLRFVLETVYDFSDCERDRPQLASQLSPRLQRQRLQAAFGS